MSDEMNMSDVLHRVARLMRDEGGWQRAVADWLDDEAEYMETTPRHKHDLPSAAFARAVAREYLSKRPGATLL